MIAQSVDPVSESRDLNSAQLKGAIQSRSSKRHLSIKLGSDLLLLFLHYLFFFAAVHVWRGRHWSRIRMEIEFISGSGWECSQLVLVLYLMRICICMWCGWPIWTLSESRLTSESELFCGQRGECPYPVRRKTTYSINSNGLWPLVISRNGCMQKIIWFGLVWVRGPPWISRT